VRTEPPALRPKKRRLSESDSDSSHPKYPRGLDGGRLHVVSDPLVGFTTPPWFNFDQSFQIPNPASTDPLDSSLFDLNFFNPPSLPSCVVPSVPGEHILALQGHAVLTINYKCPPLTSLFRRATFPPCLKYLSLIYRNQGFPHLTLIGLNF